MGHTVLGDSRARPMTATAAGALGEDRRAVRGLHAPGIAHRRRRRQAERAGHNEHDGRTSLVLPTVPTTAEVTATAVPATTTTAVSTTTTTLPTVAVVTTRARPVAAIAPAAVPAAPSGGCHPSYEGACVPANASDVDCAGGSGNGPAYVGPVRVVGPDVYDLDRDSNGEGCEN